MAITKTHPIKSTLKKAIDYICNPAKTDGKLLVSTFGCAAETADIEFAWTRKNAIDKGINLGRHLIQAFEPGETTPEQAHEIGMQLAKEILGGKYEFVLTTHIDSSVIIGLNQKPLQTGGDLVLFSFISEQFHTNGGVIVRAAASGEHPLT